MTPAQLARGALTRLAQARVEPTPANFARAYADQLGGPPPAVESDASVWVGLIERVVRGLDRGGKQWTPGRKKDSLQRVLQGSRTDGARLQQRLSQLIHAWETDGAEGSVPPPAEEAAAALPNQAVQRTIDGAAAGPGDYPRLAETLGGTLRSALPIEEPRALALADELAALGLRVQAEGATAELVDAVASACAGALRVFGHRHKVVDELLALCRALSESLGELADDESFVRGQSEALRSQLEGGPNLRELRAAQLLLAQTRQQQHGLRDERARAREALKEMIQRMLGELGELGKTTGRFNDSLGGYAEVIARADSLGSLADVVREMASETRAVTGAVAGAHERLSTEHARAGELEDRVRQLETELRRLSDEVSTDALTQIANRRGMQQAFEAERGQAVMAIGLIDIDNFKKLNDSLGHSVGDTALKSLAASVKSWLRPQDHLARYGGEEFVVLLPGTAIDEAQQTLTRLQRQLTASLFMHEGREVFVTFSAGVTAYRSGESIELALERADEALYEAKRTGKNRTCTG